MTKFLTIAGLVVAGSGGLLAQIATGDASRGEQFVRGRGCIVCHRINGEGGDRASDLATRRSRNYSPAGLAGVLWSHAPAAWAQTGAQSPGTFTMSAGQGADLFAFFASRRYLDPLGDARRGKRVFSAKQCSNCHGLRAPISDARPVVAWRSLRDPIGFAQDLWNCRAAMDPAFERQGVEHPRLTSGEMNDLLVYLDNLLGIRGKEPQFRIVSSETGRIQFLSMRCDSCHQGKLSLENYADRISIAEVQAMMWNHVLTTVKTRTAVSRDEMAGLVAYLWSLEPRGDPHRGELAFAKKGCADCHSDSAKAAPALSERDLSPVSLISAVSRHGPAMRAGMQNKSLAWPRIGRSELADMAAYLRTRHPSVLKEMSSGAAGIDFFARIPDNDTTARY